MEYPVLENICSRALLPLIFEVRDLWPESAIDTGVLTNKALINRLYNLEKNSYRAANWINVLTPAFKNAEAEGVEVKCSIAGLYNF